MTVAVQLPPAGTSPQLFVCWNLPLEIDAWMKVTLALVLFLNVTCCVRDVALNDRLEALGVTPLAEGAELPGVPVDGGVVATMVEPAADNVTRCGLLGAVLVIVKVAVAEPELDG